MLDSTRITLAGKLEEAARMSYLAARRAEYEYAVSLSASNFRISDIYRARTAQDIVNFLQALANATQNLPSGVTQAETVREDFKISVAKNVLGLTDEYLGLTGQAANDERVRRFRLWVQQNTFPSLAGISNKPVLKFRFSTTLSEKGILANVMQEGFNRYWLQKIAGLHQPWAENSGFGDQPRDYATWQHRSPASVCDARRRGSAARAKAAASSITI